MCCKSMWQQWGPPREIMERGLQSMAQVEAALKKCLTSSTRYQWTERQQQNEEGRGQKWMIQVHGVWQKCWHMGLHVATCNSRHIFNWDLCFMDHNVFYSPNDVFVSMLSISLQGLESRQVDICSYLGQPVFNGHYWLAISWIQCPRGNIFLIQLQ